MKKFSDTQIYDGLEDFSYFLRSTGLFLDKMGLCITTQPKYDLMITFLVLDN